MATGAGKRADWVRNRERLVEAAGDLVARDGVSISLEEVARRAGVGSATLHRHFPSREVLLIAVFDDGVQRVVALGREYCRSLGGEAFAAWLEELTVFTASSRGLALSLRRGEVRDNCYASLREVAEQLGASAVAEGRLRPDIGISDLLALVNGLAIQAEGEPDSARRLIRIALSGVASEVVAPNEPRRSDVKCDAPS